MYIQNLSWDHCSRKCRDGIEFIPLAPTPHDEECTPAGQDVQDNIRECRALIEQLIRMHGDPPEGAEFVLIRNDHELGTYYEAGIFYKESDIDSDEDSKSEEYAMTLESGIPDNWDELAIKQLTESGYSKMQPKEPAKLVKHQGKVVPIKSQTA